MFQQIQYFQAVVHCNSFTKAAEECHISQSAISQQIKVLEQELGIKLLNRKNQKFELTPAGEYFYKKSLVLIDDYERLCRETIRMAKRENTELRVGYLKCYSGQEFYISVAKFSQKYPDIPIHIISGNHEELYDALRTGEVDIILNDQRRMFSNEYINFSLVNSNCYIEIASRNPLAEMKFVTPQDLKNIPCILIASKKQQKAERKYYQDIVGFYGDFIFADNLEEARLMVIQDKCFMPVEGRMQPFQFNDIVVRIPLYYKGHKITRHYCAFWRIDNSGYYIEEFADILKAEFSQI